MSATLLSVWTRTVRAAPEAVALIDARTGEAWSRRELARRAEAWRHEHGGALAGATVAFSAPNGVEWMTVFLGLLGADAIAAPLDPGEPTPGQLRLAQACAAAYRWDGTRLEPLAGRRPARDGCRLIKLTSGSTGQPRAVAFTDGEMLADGHNVCRSMGIRADDRNHALIPFGHSYGLGNLVVPLLAQGTAIICGSAALPQIIAGEVARQGATVFPAVPALLRALVVGNVAPEALRGLRLVISAGAPLAPEIAQAFHARFGHRVHSFYGSTETGGIAYDRSGDAALTGRSVGCPLAGVEVRLGRDRRVHVRSAAVYTLGNRRRRDGLGEFRAADFGCWNEHGELVLLGRAGRVAKIAGRRLDLAEIELALRQLPGVTDAYACLHPERADALAAAVAATGSAAELRDALRVRLATWKIPRRLMVMPHLPLTARGKTDTRRLQQLLASPRSADAI